MLPRSEGSDENIPSPSNLRDLVPTIKVPFAISYDLNKLPSAKIRYPGYTVSIKLGGIVTIELADRVSLNYVTNKGLETSLKARTDHARGQLVSETTVSFNPATKEVVFSNKLVSESKFAGAPKTAIALEVGSSKSLPVLQAEIEYPSIRGKIGSSLFLAQNFKATIEIELDPGSMRPHLRYAPAPSPRVDVILFASGVAVLVGTIVADFLTGGGSIADDPATVPIAIGMIAAGLGWQAPTISGGQPVQQRL